MVIFCITLSAQSATIRTDRYGGSFENRIRLTLEVVDAVRAAISGRYAFVPTVCSSFFL